MSARRRAEDNQPGAKGGNVAPFQVTSSPGNPEREKSSLDSDFHRYILWAIALTLLLAAGLFSWLVVVPVWRTHRVIDGATSSFRCPAEVEYRRGSAGQLLPRKPGVDMAMGPAPRRPIR